MGQGWAVMKVLQTVIQMLSETMKQTVVKMTFNLMFIDVTSLLAVAATKASF